MVCLPSDKRQASIKIPRDYLAFHFLLNLIKPDKNEGERISPCEHTLCVDGDFGGANRTDYFIKVLVFSMKTSFKI